MQQQKQMCNKNERQSAHTYEHRNKQNKQRERMNGRTTARANNTNETTKEVQHQKEE